MKKYLLLFFVFVSCLSLSLEESDNFTEITLNEEMNRREFIINSNQTYKFINTNNQYIYFIEIKDNKEIIDENNNTIKEITSLSLINSYIILKPKNKSFNETKIYVTSILNNVKVFKFEAIHSHYYYNLERNEIFIVYVQEDDEQILNFELLENSHLFYYCKYNFNVTNPKDFNPIDKNFFIKNEEKIIHLDIGSIYIIFAELIKLDFNKSFLELFITPKEFNITRFYEADFLYLKQKDDFYNIDFKKSDRKRIMKLSPKIKDSEVIDINNNIILNKTNKYFELTEENITNGIQLKVKNNDCFIQIIFSSKNDTEVLNDFSKQDYKISKIYTIIKIPKIKIEYCFSLSSKNKKNYNNFTFGFYNKISKKDYYYNFVFLGANFNENGFVFSYNIPYLYNFEMEDDEYQIVQIYLEEKQLENDFLLNYEPKYAIHIYLLKEINEQKSEYIIRNISSILDKFYIYKDIAKKPPIFEGIEDYHHKPIDLINAINNIKTKNQTYLNLYQDIYGVLNSVRDAHLNIQLKTLENNIDISNIGICIPFQLYIEVDGNENPVVKIKLYDGCLKNEYPNQELLDNFINAHINIPLKSINKTDPFEYIQNFGKYQRYKSKHAQFSKNLDSHYDFHIQAFPLDYSDLTNIEYEFINGDIFTYDYLIYSLSSFTNIDQNEFDKFYQSLINDKKNSYIIPNIFDAKKLFMKQKEILLDENNSNKIAWNFTTKEGNLKCRVDEENKYNVFLQQRFKFDSIENAIEVMINCSELFYSNSYKIIGLENKNGGGYLLLSNIWHQLIQQKTLDKNFFALINNEKSFEFFNKEKSYANKVNIETCKFNGNLEDFGKITDDYGYSDKFKENITHNRTKVLYDYIDKSMRKKLENIRKKNVNKKENLKNPTDIIIFTDSYCYSACSVFIKSFQNTGGAIIAGFNGNPKLGLDEFDASQSASSVEAIKDKEYYDLQSLGYIINGITFAETFDSSYQNPNPKPREYAIDLVDERVPIYAPYSDNLYNDFIKKANDIFKKYENNCNKNNTKFLLDDENCFVNDTRKGGHPCGENGEWDMTKCEAYYCQLGYYYDQFKKECVLDICTNGKERDINLDKEGIYNNSKEYDLEIDDEIVFRLPNDNYYYFFETNNSNNKNILSSYNQETLNIGNKSNFYMVEFKRRFFDFEVNANYYKTLKENIKIKIISVKKEPNIFIKLAQNLNNIQIDGENIITEKNNWIYSLESKNNHILYTVTYSKDLNIYYSIYNKKIEPQDIIYLNKNKFSIISNRLISIKQNDIGIVIFENKNNYSLGQLYVNPKDTEQNIIISDNRFIYLSEKNFTYNLNLLTVSKKACIKLNNETLNSEIEILGSKMGKLNKNSRYYYLDNNIKNLILQLKNDRPALIELLYEYESNNDTYLDINQNNFELKKGFYALRYKKSHKIKTIVIYIDSTDKLKGYIFPTIAKNNYSSLFPLEINFEINNIKSEFIFPEEKIEDDEDFIIFIKLDNKFNLSIELNKNNDEDKFDIFPIWAIILIVFIVILIILGVLVIIIRKYKNKKNTIDFNNYKEERLLLMK